MERLPETRPDGSLGGRSEGLAGTGEGSLPVTAALHLLRSSKKTGFLFSGGSMRCIFQVGVLEPLRELRITPAMTLGVSGGAWNAAAVAAGNGHRLRGYWRFFSRMPYVDLRNLVR